jgi:hypothetical protein
VQACCAAVQAGASALCPPVLDHVWKLLPACPRTGSVQDRTALGITPRSPLGFHSQAWCCPLVWGQQVSTSSFGLISTVTSRAEVVSDLSLGPQCPEGLAQSKHCPALINKELESTGKSQILDHHLFRPTCSHIAQRQ